MVLGPESVQLDGRVALVTGAAMGIGAATARALARFGADLALCDREAEPLEEVAASIRTGSDDGRRVVTGVLDVRDGDAVRRFCARVGDELGRVDVLVNNAAGTFRAPFLELSDHAQAALVAENFTSATHFVRALVPLVGEGGSIVNVTSIEAHRAGPGFAVYSAMKAALVNLTQSLALELGDRGIRVNCVAPDVIPTPGIGDVDAETPLARRGHADDVAGAVLFLASGLSAFVTGSTVHVDGGNHAAGGWRRTPDGSFEP